MLGLLLLFSVGSYQYTSIKMEKVEQEAVNRQIKIQELKTYKASMLDSLEFYREENRKLIKLIAVQEKSIKSRPNEKEILKKYRSMDDSTAIAIFRKRYGNIQSEK